MNPLRAALPGLNGEERLVPVFYVWYYFLRGDIPMTGGYEKIVTHNDFDGVVSASLCAGALKIEKVTFAGPLAITHSRITITEKDVVCDLPYPLQCGLWFDHHEGNIQELEYRRIDPKSIPGRFDLKPSCSRVVYEYFSERLELPSYLLQTVEEADVIDGFSYVSMEDWRRETPGKVVDLTLKVRFLSAGDQSAYMRNLVQQLRDRPIEAVAELSFVQKRLKQYREEEGQMLRTIRDSSYFLEEDGGEEVVVIDLTRYRRRPHLIRNLAFLVNPEALGVIEVYNLTDQGVKSNHLGISMSLSVHGNRKSSKNVGEIMRLLNIGDGHPGAAAGTVRCSSKQEMWKKKKEILSQIFRLWSSQQISQT
jgi:oligoribonuclease NrnB/cAMP/cGMP phosphodiesterase (DHH superfamily)